MTKESYANVRSDLKAGEKEGGKFCRKQEKCRGVSVEGK